MRPAIPRSLDTLNLNSNILDPSTKWKFELWQALLDAQEIILDIGRDVSRLDKSALASVQTIPLPTNETITLHERDLARLSTTKTEAHMNDLVLDFLLEPLFLDPFWKPIKDYICLTDFKKLDPSLQKPTADLVVVHIRLLHVIFWAKTRHIALFVKEVKASGSGATQLMQEGLETLRKLVACVDEMNRHVHGEGIQALATDGSPLPLTHLGRTINSECFRLHSIKAGFNVSSMHRYISLRTMMLVLGSMHIVTIVMTVYLRWPLWISLAINFIVQAINHYGYYTSFESGMRSNDESRLSKSGAEQIYTLHALIYVYLHLSINEAAYMLLWTGGLCGLNHLFRYWLLEGKQDLIVVGAYDVMAIYYVFCGIHLHHGWLALAIGSWLAGSVFRTYILSFLSRFDLVSAICAIDVPVFFLFLYLFENVSFIRTAGMFLYQLFIPFIMEVAIKKMMDMFGWQSSPIDLSGSIIRGIMNVLMVFWGFSSLQAFALTMVIQTMSSLQALAPHYGMR